MTYSEILRKYQGIKDVKVDEFRPAWPFYVDDLIGKIGIRIWLENGDSVIYFPKVEGTEK